MNLGVLSSTRCLAIAFQQEFSLAARSSNIYDVFKSFMNANISNNANPYLNQALKKCLLLGHIEPFVILVGGDEISLRTLKSCWMRAQLQPPPGFRIESIGACLILCLYHFHPISITKQDYFNILMSIKSI